MDPHSRDRVEGTPEVEIQWEGDLERLCLASIKVGLISVQGSWAVGSRRLW